MIDLKRVHKSHNSYFDGLLDDGRPVEFKTDIPSNFDNIIRQVVAMANTDGGFIIFGVNGRKLSIVGLRGDYNQLIRNLELAIKRLSLGITYQISHEVIDNKDVVTLGIEKSESTSYFSRVETSPARQSAYKYTKNTTGKYSLTKREMRYSKVFKYMTLDTFLTSLYTATWRFFEPSKWNDKFEQRFYCANYILPDAIGNTPQLFATCLTSVKNSEAAWKVYSNGQGLGAHCLQLEIDIVELRKQLRASGLHFEERLVIYKPENVIINLHKKRKPYYNEYFSSFTLDSFLTLLSLKRDAYTYEQELRLFLIPSNGGKRNKCKKAQHKDLNINWRNIISKVRIDKKCTDAELISIQSACFYAGINPIIKNYNFIGNLTPRQDIKNIDFERFDIDDMPGSSNITIY